MKEDIENAIRSRDLPRLVELLNEAGDNIDLDARDYRGDTALCVAAECSFPEIVELLLSRGATPDVPSDEQPYDFPLHIVSLPGGPNNLEIAQILIRNGASVDVVDAFGSTPLQNAVATDYFDMVEFLLRQGADPFFDSSRHVERVENEPERSVLFLAIDGYDRNGGRIFRLIWRWMMQLKQENNSFPVDDRGDTALHFAARKGKAVALVTMLKACACKTDLAASALNSSLESPLAVAISARNLKAALCLLTLGGQPGVSSNFAADPNSSQVTLASPLLRAFKMMLPRVAQDSEFPDPDPCPSQEQCDRLCQMIVNSGYPLGEEKWLNYDFPDVLLGPAGPIEFRDVTGENVPDHELDTARSAFESLRRQRRSPLRLKSLARLAIRRSVMENPCLGCRYDATGKTSLEGLMESLGLPSKLRFFVTFLEAS